MSCHGGHGDSHIILHKVWWNQDFGSNLATALPVESATCLGWMVWFVGGFPLGLPLPKKKKNNNTCPFPFLVAFLMGWQVENENGLHYASLQITGTRTWSGHETGLLKIGDMGNVTYYQPKPCKGRSHEWRLRLGEGDGGSYGQGEVQTSMNPGCSEISKYSTSKIYMQNPAG